MARASRRSSAPTRSFKYQKRDSKKIQERLNSSGQVTDSMFVDEVAHLPTWKPKEGENIIRILPPGWDDPDHYGIDIHVHYGVGPDNSAYLDLTKHKQLPDPITEENQQARRDGDEEYSKSTRAVRRVLVYLLDMKEKEKGVQLYAMPFTMDADILKDSRDPETKEVMPVDDPDEGHNIYVTRDGIGERTKYHVKVAPRPSKVDLTDEILEVIEDHPLPNILKFYTYEHIKAVFEGKGVVDEDQDEQDKAPPRRSREEKKEPDVQPEKSAGADDIRAMEGTELDSFIEDNGLDVDPSSFDSDEELQDAIIQAMGLEPAAEPEPEPVKEPESEPEPEPEPEPDAKTDTKSRLAGLRQRLKR